MHWTRGRRSFRIIPRGESRGVGQADSCSLISACLLILASTVFLRGAPGEKHLSVYSVAANYSLPLVEREGQDYVGLLELLEPLGTVSARMDGARWRLRYNNVEGIFQTGTNRAQVLGRDADLGGAFLMENNRGLVPLGSLSSLLPRILGGPVSVHEVADRLFIGSVATHFTALLSAEETPRLVFRFSSAVNPVIATEAGQLRMTFSRDPLVGPASPTLTFGSKVISSATYSESNGSAVITVNASVPVIATFSNEGRAITITPTAAPAQTGTQSAASATAAQTAQPAQPA